MEITLEMVDQLRSRAGVSFAEAVTALERAGGDVVKALLLLEEEGKDMGSGAAGDLKHREAMGRSKLSKAVKKTGMMNIKINRGKRTLAELPLAIALGTALLFPRTWSWVVLGLLAARFSLVADQEEQSV
ncbi:MAG: hypothetical protein GX767_04250 [Firmicutes bacterium]|nr:hypothetical protein [Bacillota bacterium]